MSQPEVPEPVVERLPDADERSLAAYGYKALVKRLQSAQKSSQGAPAYSRYVNRPLGRRLAALAACLGLTPNAVTAVSGLFSFAAIAAIGFVRPTVATGILVMLGLVIGYALDAADGQLARLRGGGSVSGEWLDHMVDAFKASALHLAVLILIARWFDLSNLWLLIPATYALVDSVSFFAMTLNDHLRRLVALKARSDVPGTGSSWLRSVLVLPNDYGLLCLTFVLLGWPMAFVVAYTVMLVGALGYLLLGLPKWFRAMRDLDQRLRDDRIGRPS